jgi:hypothetical protein
MNDSEILDAMQAIRERVQVVKADGEKLTNKLTYDKDGNLDAIFCPLTGEMIAGMVPYGEPTVTRQNGEIHREQKVKFSYMSNYGQVRLDMSDGSGHVTHVSKSILGLLTPTAMEKLYLTDLVEAMQEHSKLGMKFPYHVWAFRKPTGYTVEKS